MSETDQSNGGSNYLQRALQVLERFNILAPQNAPAELTRLLEEVRPLDEAKVLSIARTIEHMGSFNALVRDNVEDISMGDRYIEITQMFDSIREDSKTLIKQLDDGQVSVSERMQNLWMRIRRGSPHSRFEKIVDVYKNVTEDTAHQLERERAIMEGYIEFRFALKEAEVASQDLFELQTPRLQEAQETLVGAQRAVDELPQDVDASERSRLELARDEARRRAEDEDRTYQLLKDITENLAVGYDVGETLITKLKQTHDVKERVYRRAVTFFTTNEHVFTILSTVYTAQHGLHEATEATEAMAEGANRGLEDVAELGRELERAALKAGYGSTIKAESVEKLVQAISEFQVESLTMIADLRRESDQNAREVRRVVEEGKQKYRETLARYLAEDT